MTTVVHGPQACGKTRNRDLLAVHLGCNRIIDGWDATFGEIEVRHGDLLLTTSSPAQIRRRFPRARIIAFDKVIGEATARFAGKTVPKVPIGQHS
jgi:hypothetical protein